MARSDDIAAIREVIDRYALGVDRRDWDMVAGCFTDGCRADYGRSGGWEGRSGFIRALEDMHAPIGPTLHRMTNHVVDVDGDTATAVSYLDALLEVAHRGFDLLHVAAIYSDRLRLTADGWRIAERRVDNYLWRREHTRGTPPDPLRHQRPDQEEV